MPSTATAVAGTTTTTTSAPVMPLTALFEALIRAQSNESVDALVEQRELLEQISQRVVTESAVAQLVTEANQR